MSARKVSGSPPAPGAEGSSEPEVGAERVMPEEKFKVTWAVKQDDFNPQLYYKVLVVTGRNMKALPVCDREGRVAIFITNENGFHLYETREPRGEVVPGATTTDAVWIATFATKKDLADYARKRYNAAIVPSDIPD